jgi:hypothetical protein
MSFLPLLDGMVELLEIGYRSRPKFDPTKFKLLLVNNTDAITQNATFMQLLKLELSEADGYRRAAWTPTAAAVKNISANSADFAPVLVAIAKLATPIVTQQWDCVVLVADASAGANKLITSIVSNAFQATAHGFVAGDRVFFDGATAYPAVVVADTYYFVSATSLTADQFRVAATSGGATLTVASSFTGLLRARCANGVAIGYQQVPTDGVGNNTRNFEPGQTVSISVEQGMV